MKKGGIFLLLSFFVFSFIYAADPANKVIAKVGNEPILISDLDEITKPLIEQYKKVNPDFLKNDGEKTLKQNVLNQMIDEKIALQEAKKQKLTVSKRKEESAYSEIKSRFKDEAEFKKELANLNISEAKFKEKINNQLLVMELIDKEVKNKQVEPAEEELRKYYTEHEKEMVEPEAVKIRHILIKVESEKDDKDGLKKIKDIKVKLDKGGDFAALAAKYSDDKVSSERGGDIGLFMKGQMVKEFEDAAFKLNVGQISDVIKTKYGYHILRCDEKRLEQKKTFDEVKNYLKQYLYQTKLEQDLKDYIAKLKTKTNIVINEL